MVVCFYYFHGDHLGTATFVTNSQSQATQFFLNLPFGETMIEQMDGSYDNPFKFNAKELDEDTGLYYYGARYYKPRLSIWYGVDPLTIYKPVMEIQFYGDGQHNGGVYFWVIITHIFIRIRTLLDTLILIESKLM